MIEFLDDVYVVRDDTSCLGLRRLHLLSDQELDAERILRGVLAEGGEITAWYAWKDKTLGNYHLYIGWRYKMTGPAMWAVNVDGTLDNTIQRAVVGYRKRFKKLPNRAIVRRNGVDLDGQEIQMMDEQGEELGEIRIVAVDTGWQNGVIGVWRDDGGADEQERAEVREAVAV